MKNSMSFFVSMESSGRFVNVRRSVLFLLSMEKKGPNNGTWLQLLNPLASRGLYCPIISGCSVLFTWPAEALDNNAVYLDSSRLFHFHCFFSWRCGLQNVTNRFCNCTMTASGDKWFVLPVRWWRTVSSPRFSVPLVVIFTSLGNRCSSLDCPSWAQVQPGL